MNGDTVTNGFTDGEPRRNSSLDLGVDYQWDEISDIPTKDDHTSESHLQERVRKAELEALKARALQKKAEAQKEQILVQVQEAEAKCLREVELMTKTFLARLNDANHHVQEAQENRYIAEEVKRLTEEKFTLYKYESERNVHDLKQILDDALLERDELLAALKSVGKDFDHEENKRERRDSIKELEEKYQRYISTSDKTIQSLKEQLNEVVKLRDQLASERDASRAEGRDIRVSLDKALKEKQALSLKLEKANCEVERLEEIVSASSQKREQVERERDQLQLLTDMSLMKLKQAEAPKKTEMKRHSISAIGSFKENFERSDRNLKELSNQLRDLMSPASKHRQVKLEDSIHEVNELPSSDDATQSKKIPKQPRIRNRRKSSKSRKLPSLPDLGTSEDKVGRETTTVHVTAAEDESEKNRPSSPSRFVSINYVEVRQSDEENGEETREYIRPTPAPVEVMIRKEPGVNQHVITPAIHVQPKGVPNVPEIEISFVDENENVAKEVGSSDEEQPSSLTEDEDIEHELYYEIDGFPNFPEGVPRTSL